MHLVNFNGSPSYNEMYISAVDLGCLGIHPGFVSKVLGYERQGCELNVGKENQFPNKDMIKSSESLSRCHSEGVAQIFF